MPKKNQVGYALWSRKNPIQFDSRFPIYHLRSVAKEAQIKYGGEIVEVLIIPEED